MAQKCRFSQGRRASLPSTPASSQRTGKITPFVAPWITPFVAPFYTKTDHFTKTGSGQTQEKLRKERRFLIGHCRAPGTRGGAPLCDRERSTRPRNDAPHPQELRVAAVGEGGARAPRPVSRRGCGGKGLVNEAPVRGCLLYTSPSPRD